MNAPFTQNVGRFAPSPTGKLHLGSVVSAIGSFLQAKSSGGKWLVRIEDIDPPREIPGSAEGLVQDLSWLRMKSDEPVLFQSQRLSAYDETIDALLASGQAYPCGCTRSELPPGKPYPGTCRHGLRKGKRPRSIRVKVPDKVIAFEDAVWGNISENLSTTCGDFVIRRADGLTAYQLAVVVDDAEQQVSEVVRGADLLDSTPRQIYLQTLLGLARPTYAHLPLVTSPDGKKLSKRLASDPFEKQSPSVILAEALRFLGQEPPGGLKMADLWDWAHEHWNLGRIKVDSA